MIRTNKYFLHFSNKNNQVERDKLVILFKNYFEILLEKLHISYTSLYNNVYVLQIKSNKSRLLVLLCTIQSRDNITKSRLKQGLII